MTHAAVWLATLVCLGLSAGCDRVGNDVADAQGPEVQVPGIESLPAKPGDIIATVNGRPLTEGMLDLYSTSRHQQHPLGGQPQRRELTNELINMELLAQEAAHDGLDRRADIATELYFQRANRLASAMMEQRAQDAGIDDAEVERRYRARYPDGKITEYRTRQILVNERHTAADLIRKLRAGGDFAQLAKQHSKGPAAAHGGALQWFQPSQVLAEFAAAVESLEVGEFTKTPVHTTYGWHIILLEDKREAAAPPLDQVAPGIVRELITGQLDHHLDELRAKANIKTERQ